MLGVPDPSITPPPPAALTASNAMQPLEKRIHHRNIHHQAPTTNIDYNKYQPLNTSDTLLSRFTLLECTKFNEEETAPFIDDDLYKLVIHPVVYASKNHATAPKSTPKMSIVL